MTKRIICILMMLVLASQGCFAQRIIFGSEEAEEYIPLGGVLIKEGETILLEEEPISFFSTSGLPLDEYIAGFIEEHMNEYNELPMRITGLDQSAIPANEFMGKYTDAVMKHPETMLFTGCKALYGVTGSDIVYQVAPIYCVSDKPEADLAREKMETAVAEYVALAKNYDTDLEKLLVVHDKMVADCDYDVSIFGKTEEELIGNPVFHASGALCNQKAVCQGFSQALYMIGKAIGIEMDFCSSDEKSHMWNYVKVDDKWYHMDMTNDDFPDNDGNGNPVPRKDTRAWHRYFMMSDSGLKEDVHGTDYGSIAGEKIICDDSRYETNHLFNIHGMPEDRIVFTAERAEDGYFHVPVEIKIPDENIDTIVDFKSESLYTGSIVTSPVKIKVSNADAKEVTNLYLAQYTTRSIPVVKPFVKKNDGIKAYDVQEESTKDTFNMVQIAKDVEKNPVEEFTAYFLEPGTLCPWSIAKTWNLQ